MPQIQLRYHEEINRRIWLRDDGFERLHMVILKGCDLICELSASLPSERDYNLVFHDVFSRSVSFTLFDTDTYPSDGYKSIFFCPHDKTPGPFGDFGFGVDNPDERAFTVYCGHIAPNPDHGRLNASQRCAPRLRKSIFVPEWSFSAVHHFSGGAPTSNFSYWFLPMDLQGSNSSSSHGLLREFGLEFITSEQVKQLDSYRHLLKAEPSFELGYQSYFEQEWDPDMRRWRGVASGRVRAGWLTSEKRKFLLD